MSTTTVSGPAGGLLRAQPWVSLVLRLGLAGVALWAGLAKIVDLDASVRAVRAYRLLPEALAQPVGYGLPMLEIVLGLLMLAGLFTRVAASLFGLCMVAFIIGISSAWARGLAIDCGCFGGGGEVDPSQTAYLEEILRDTAFLAAAAVLAAWPRSRYSADHALDLEPAR